MAHKKNSRRLDRRTMLRLLGAGGAGVAMSGSWPIRRLLSQVQAVPKRVIVIGNGDGLPTDTWYPRARSGMSAPTRTDFELGPLWDPIADYQSRMMFFRNLDMKTVHVDDGPQGNAHTDASTHALAATNRYPDHLPGGISIDQLIAAHINRDEPVTRFPSAQIRISAEDGHNDMSSPGPGVIVPTLNRPEDIYDTYFADAYEAATATAPEVGEDSESGRIGRLLDFVDEDFAAMEERLPIAANRSKIRDHRSGLSAYRQQLTAELPRADRVPSRSIISGAEALDWSYNADRASVWMERYNASADMNINMITQLLAADLTRVVFLNIHGAPQERYGFGEAGGGEIHDHTHAMHDQFKGTRGANYEEGVSLLYQEAQDRLRLVRTLVDRLASTIEPDGTSLLDNTLVFSASHVGNGGHATQDLAWYTVGNLQGYFRTGQYLDFGTSDWPGHGQFGRPHNDLLTTIANGMDVPITTFGREDIATGPISEMRA